jgi:energy-coupling factor transporter ATP-binding protein EcfA2
MDINRRLGKVAIKDILFPAAATLAGFIVALFVPAGGAMLLAAGLAGFGYLRGSRTKLFDAGVAAVVGIGAALALSLFPLPLVASLGSFAAAGAAFFAWRRIPVLDKIVNGHFGNHVPLDDSHPDVAADRIVVSGESIRGGNEKLTVNPAAAKSALEDPIAAAAAELHEETKWLGYNPRKMGPYYTTQKQIAEDWNLFIGMSSGILGEQRHHRHAIAPGQTIRLHLSDAEKHILIVGDTGSGKTRGGIKNLLNQVLRQPNTGAMIFDVKGSFKKDVAEIAGPLGRKINVVGPGGISMNLLKDKTPEFVKGVFATILDHGTDNKFFTDSALNMIGGALSIMWAAPGLYTITTLRRVVSDDDYRKQTVEFAKAMAVAMMDPNDSTYDPDRARIVESGLEYYATDFKNASKATNTFESIRSTVTSLISQFDRHNPLTKAFCDTTVGAFGFEELYTGGVFVLSLSLSDFKASGPFVCRFVKELFFDTVKKRADMPKDDPRRANPIVFMCDEYQAVISWEDSRSWDTVREYHCVGIVATQSIVQLYASLNDENRARTILANFVQKLVFRSGDPITHKFFEDALGKSLRVETNTSISDNPLAVAAHNQQQGIAGALFGTLLQDTSSTSESTSLQERSVVNADIIRGLQGNDEEARYTALALLTIKTGGKVKAMDDILYVRGPQTLKLQGWSDTATTLHPAA